MQLNLVADKPTVNGRIYSKKSLKKSLSKKNILILLDATSQYDESFYIQNIGVANLNKFTDDKITFEAQFASKTDTEKFKDYKLSISGRGNVNKDNQVTDFTLTHLFPEKEE